MTSGAAWASPTPPGDCDALWAASGSRGPRLPALVEHLSALRVDSGSCCSRGLGWPPRSASFSPFHCHVTSASGRGVSEPLVPSHLSDGNVSAGKANEPGPHRPTVQPAGASLDAGKGGTPVGRPGDPAEETRVATPNPLCSGLAAQPSVAPSGVCVPLALALAL